MLADIRVLRCRVGPFGTTAGGQSRLNEFGKIIVEEVARKWSCLSDWLYTCCPTTTFKLRSQGATDDEIESVANSSLVHAVIRWNPERSRLKTFARFEILEHYRRWVSGRAEAHREGLRVDQFGTWRNDYGDLDTAEPACHVTSLRTDVDDEIEDVLRSVKSRDKEVIRKYFGIGHDKPLRMSEVAVEVGITESRVSQILSSTIAQLRDRFSSKSSRESFS